MTTVAELPRTKKPVINSGDASVIASGSVIAFDDRASVEIAFTVEDGEFKLILEQASDTTDPKPRWEFKGSNGNPLQARIRLINLQGTPIAALPSPARLWTGPERSIFLQLRYVSLPGFSPMFHYTVFLKPEGGSVA